MSRKKKVGSLWHINIASCIETRRSSFLCLLIIWSIKNNSVIAAWSNIQFHNVWRAQLSVYVLLEWRRILSVRTFSRQSAYLQKLELFFPSLKTSLLTVRESKPLLWCRQLEQKGWCRMQMWELLHQQKRWRAKKSKQFLSFSCEDRSAVFLLWAKTITSVSTYGTSGESRFVNLTKTVTTGLVNGGQKSYAD